jgi:hypothetical protein
MKKIIITAAAGLAIAIAGCSSAASGGQGSGQVGQAPINGSTAPASAAVPAGPVNPVPILKATGAHVPASEVLGDHDIFGDRMAEGSMHGEDILVYTAASSTALHQMLQRQTFTVDDFTGVIVIPAKNAAVVASASPEWSTNSGTPTPIWAHGGTPAQIAKRVGGQLKG